MNKIPKIIHYCWFGGKPLPKLAIDCINSWKKYLVDYEFMLWDENSFDINSCEWTKDAFAAGKMAFVADYVRLYALKKYGGIYLDTDIKVKKKFDDLLNYDGFMCFERNEILCTACIASVNNHPMIDIFLDYYNSKFDWENIKLNNIANAVFMTKNMVDLGLKKNNKTQIVNQMTIFPKTYFNPRDFWGNWDLSKDTYCIHLYMGSWLSDKEQKKLERRRNFFWMMLKRINDKFSNFFLFVCIKKLLKKIGII